MATVVENPQEYWVVKPSELEEVEELLKRLDKEMNHEIGLPEEGTSTSRKTIFKGGKSIRIGKFVSNLALAAVAAALEYLIERKLEDVKKERRRRKIQLCYTTCVAIVETAMVDSEYWTNFRALGTYDASRYHRRFKSRKV